MKYSMYPPINTIRKHLIWRANRSGFTGWFRLTNWKPSLKVKMPGINLSLWKNPEKHLPRYLCRCWGNMPMQSARPTVKKDTETRFTSCIESTGRIYLFIKHPAKPNLDSPGLSASQERMAKQGSQERIAKHGLSASQERMAKHDLIGMYRHPHKRIPCYVMTLFIFATRRVGRSPCSQPQSFSNSRS